MDCKFNCITVNFDRTGQGFYHTDPNNNNTNHEKDANDATKSLEISTNKISKNFSSQRIK